MERVGQSPDGDEPAVLVVYVNGAVALALAARLLDHAVVTLAPITGALQALSAGARVDVVILCPYLDRAERACVTAAIGTRGRPSPWVQLVDLPQRAVGRLHGPTDQTPGESRALAKILESLET